jgi:hypothetical protein
MSALTMAAWRRVLMQKVAKELLSMLSWPTVTARFAAAEAAVGPLSAGNLAAVHALATAGSSSTGHQPAGIGGGAVVAGAAAAAGQLGGLDLEVLRKMMQVRLSPNIIWCNVARKQLWLTSAEELNLPMEGMEIWQQTAIGDLCAAGHGMSHNHPVLLCFMDSLLSWKCLAVALTAMSLCFDKGALMQHNRQQIPVEKCRAAWS